MPMIREKCAEWSDQTFEQMLLHLCGFTGKIIERTSKCFSELELTDKSVDGYASEKLPKTEEGRAVNSVNYTDTFHDVLGNDNFTPVLYLATLVERFFDTNGQDGKLNGFIARGIRTLTSFLREPDFAESLKECMADMNLPITAELSPIGDAADHTDVLLTLNGEIYRVWLFQSSKRGLPHDIDRITGKRGELPAGIHVLCPLRTELAMDFDKKRKQSDKEKEKIINTKDALSRCSVKAVKTRAKLEDRLNNYKQKRLSLESELKGIEPAVSEELDIVEGWYFYSGKHVRRIAELIKQCERMDYYEVVRVLLAPEVFLATPKIFVK